MGSSSRSCAIVGVIIATIFIALGTLITMTGGLLVTATSTTPTISSGGPFTPLGLGSSHDIFFSLFFILIPLVLTFVVLFKSSHYDFPFKITALVFCLVSSYSLFYQAIAEALFVSNTTSIMACIPPNNGQLSLAQVALCNAGRVTAGGMWILFFGQTILMIVNSVMAVNDTESSPKSNPQINVQSSTGANPAMDQIGSGQPRQGSLEV